MLLDRRVPSGPRLAPLCAMPRTHGSRRVPRLYSSVSSCATYPSDPLMTRRFRKVRPTRYRMVMIRRSLIPHNLREQRHSAIRRCGITSPSVLGPGRDRHAARGRAADVRMMGAIERNPDALCYSQTHPLARTLSGREVSEPSGRASQPLHDRVGRRTHGSSRGSPSDNPVTVWLGLRGLHHPVSRSDAARFFVT